MKKIGLLLIGIVSIFGVVGNASAASMPNAIDGKITLSEDLQLTETFTVSEGEEITLDLAGHTITGSADIDYYTIENNGNLTIIDTGETKGKIICLEDNSSCIINNNELTVDGVFATSLFATIKNETTGNLIVKNSTIETTREGNSQTVGFTGALQNWGVAEVSNTTILAENEYGVFVRSNDSVSSNTIIKDSNISADYAIYNEKLGSSTTRQNVTVSDTEITGKISKLSGVDYTFSGDIKVHTNHNFVNNVILNASQKGTNVIIDVDFTSTLVIPDNVTVTIAEGKSLTVGSGGIKIGNGKLVVDGELKNANVYLENTNAYYTTLRYAVNAVPLDSKDINIKLLADTKDTSAISMSRKDITIDLNGHTATLPKYTVANNAVLTIKDSSELGNGTIDGAVTNNGTLTIDGGKFLTLPTTGADATTTITGGTFTSDVVEGIEIPENKEVIVNDDGTSSIVYKIADYTKVNEAIENAKTIDRSKYTEESLKALDDVLNSLDMTLRLDKQDTVDAYATLIEDAINNLVEKTTEVEVPTEDIENPSTNDNVLTYVVAGVVALIGITGTVIYLKKHNN